MIKLLEFICLFLFVFIYKTSNSQPKTEYHLKYNFKQNDELVQFTVLDYELKAKRFYNDRHYFWVKSQEIIETQGGAGGRLLHGQFIAYYENKQLSKKGNFNKGLKNGEWIYWSKNGEIFRIENWSNGIKIGKEKIFVNGKMDYSILHSRSKQKFNFTDSLVIYKNEVLVKKATFENGKRVSLRNYRNGRLHGRTFEVTDNGSKKVTWYKKGKALFTGEKKQKQKKEDKKSIKTRIQEIRAKKTKN